MTGRRRRMIAASGLLGAACLFAAGLLAGGPGVADDPAAARAGAGMATQGWRPARLTQSDQFWQRPLFMADRRPPRPKPAPSPAVAVAAVPPPPLLLPAADLSAVALGPAGRVAVIKLRDGKSRVMTEGETIDGWRLTEVAHDYVVFHHDTTVEKLMFTKQHGGASSLAAANGLGFIPSFGVQRR